MAPQNQQQEPAAATVRLPDFYADSPQSWFDCIDTMFAAAKITQPLTKLHWALAKLSFSLIATVRPLSRVPSASSDPYMELQELLLRSYGLSAAQMTSRWLDYPAEEATAAAAAPRPHTPFRGARRSPSPFRGKGSACDKSARRRSPTRGPPRGGRNDRLCFYHSRFGAKAQKCEKGCSYQEN
jgi:hypothetical protein